MKVGTRLDELCGEIPNDERQTGFVFIERIYNFPDFARIHVPPNCAQLSMNSLVAVIVHERTAVGIAIHLDDPASITGTAGKKDWLKKQDCGR